MAKEARELGDLISIGPAMLRDFELLGVKSVAELARRDPEQMYRQLGRVAKQHQDICVLDTFHAAVAQARDPRLPAEQCQWWYLEREAEGREENFTTEDTEVAEFGAEEQEKRMKRKKKNALTTPDLVLLSLLAERGMHGYQANAELERRCIRDWAAISRPQVYYSLEKLARDGFVRVAANDEAAAGPERSVYETSAKGRAALADALEREDWAMQRDRPAFLTWVALSWLARPGILAKQIARRREFLEREIAREEETLESILEEVGHPYHEAAWMVTLMIEQLRTELKWLKKVARELPQRGRAKHPAYAEPKD